MRLGGPVALHSAVRLALRLRAKIGVLTRAADGGSKLDAFIGSTRSGTTQLREVTRLDGLGCVSRQGLQGGSS